MGLGPIASTTLKSARAKAEAARAMANDGADPIAHREQQRQKAALEAAIAQHFGLTIERQSVAVAKRIGDCMRRLAFERRSFKEDGRNLLSLAAMRVRRLIAG